MNQLFNIFWLFVIATFIPGSPAALITNNPDATAIISAAATPTAGPTLSADAVQPGYPGTSTPFLTIVAGSGKTSYVSAVLNDPTDPAATTGIVFTVSDTGALVNATTSNPSVVNSTGISIAAAAGKRTVRIVPNGIGYATISLKATTAGGNSSTYKISYAASAPSSAPSNTFFHTASSDASGSSVVDSNYMFIADDENNVLRLYNRHYSGTALYGLDISAAVGASEECDLEAATSSVAYNAGRRMYWIGSLGNSKSGNLKPDRNIAFATDMAGTGANTTLSVKSYSRQMRPSLISWGDSHGWNFTAGAASGMIPKRIDGFNVEGLAVAPGGDTVYIGFRAPCVPVSGVTPTSANRRYALLAPVLNFETLFNSNNQVNGLPTIGDPVLFDLDGLGIRSIEKTPDGKYVIVAGLYTGGGSPAVYLWDGVVPPDPGRTPITVSSPVSRLIKLNLPGLQQLVQVSSDGQAEGHPEAMTAEVSGDRLVITLICDDGTVDYYNDGTEAKSLSHDEFKKFRSDVFVCAKDTMPASVNLCPAVTSASLLSNITGENYTWQWDTCGTGNCFTNIGTDNHFTGVNSRTLTIQGFSSAWSGYRFRCITDGNTGNEYTLKFLLNWTGAINNSWETPGNWDCNHLPDQHTDVFINYGNPVLNSNAAVRSLSLGNAARLTINAGKNLSTVH